MMSASTSEAIYTADPLSRLAPYNPVTADVHDAVLAAIGGLRPSDLFLDIGSGDARLLAAVRAATGCQCAGIEYNADLHERALARFRRGCAATDVHASGDADSLAAVCTHTAAASPVMGAALFLADATTFDYAANLAQPPSVVFAYLVPDGLRRMRATLLGLLAAATAVRDGVGADSGGGGGAACVRPPAVLITYMFQLPPPMQVHTDAACEKRDAARRASVEAATSTNCDKISARRSARWQLGPDAPADYELVHVPHLTARRMLLHVYQFWRRKTHEA